MSLIATRSSFRPLATSYSNSQVQLEALSSKAAAQVLNPAMLSAMTAGSFIGHLARLGTLACGAQAGRFGTALHFLSYGISLGSEALAFETTHRAFQNISEHSTNQNLWNWEGQGGLREGVFAAFFTIGSLKVFGRMAQNQSSIVQHLSSDLGLVASQNALSLLPGSSAPEGSLFAQLVHAETLRLQLALGGQILRGLLPSITFLERNLERGIQSSSFNLSRAQTLETTILSPRMAANRRKTPVDHYEETVVDPDLSDRMSFERERVWADEFIRGQNGVVGLDIEMEFNTRDYLRYRDYLIARMARGETNLIPEIRLAEEALRTFRIPFTPFEGPGDPYVHEDCVIFDAALLGLDTPLHHPSPDLDAAAQTMAVSGTAIGRMLEASPTPGLAPAPIELIPPAAQRTPTAEQSSRSWWRVALNTLVQPFRKTPPVEVNPTRLSIFPNLVVQGPFTYDASTGFYEYQFPRGVRPITLGRQGEHAILGDATLSKTHVTIRRQIDPSVTAYILTAHNLTIIHRATGGQSVVDHGKNAWLNPGDRVQLTENFSFIFRPQ